MALRHPGRNISNTSRNRLGKRIQQVQPKYGWLPEIRYVQIQTHSRCNADCVFCPYIESEHAKAPGMMKDETWDLILSNLVPFTNTINQGKICPYLMQEPLIDKTIFKKITDIYELFSETCVEVSTNGAALIPKTVDSLFSCMDGKNHEIWVSHHGIDEETFSHIMKIDYAKATENLLNLIRTSDGRFRIKIRGAGESQMGNRTYFTRQQYLDYWKEQSEKHNLNMQNVSIDAFQFHDRAGTLHRTDRGANEFNAGIVRRIDKKNPFYCVRLDQWVHFMWDGTIRLCCMDYHGEVKLPNIHDMSLLDYYHGSDYFELTEQISGRKGCKPGHICTRCLSPGG